jgi:putative membrane protein
MLVGALVIVARLHPAPGRPRSAWTWAAWAALLLLAWDVSMDPAMVATGHWRWGSGDQFHAANIPGVVADFFTRGVFYGMPLANWLGWFLTAAVIARIMLLILPPAELTARIANSPLPVVLYLANGVMPVALCLREGFWWAAILGSLAMLIPAYRALRGSATGPEFRSVPESA